jgi:cbb3-type cytochrome oxidase cytochrome c subunit
MHRRWLVVPVIALSVIAFGVAAQERAATQAQAERGRRLFVDQGCHGCHTIKALGTPIGPDLSHVGARYSESYLKRWLRDPQAQRPSAHMPQLELTEPQLEALAAFLSSLD